MYDLTIFIPTFNRAHILAHNAVQLLSRVEKSDLFKLSLKVIFANNHSSDNTPNTLLQIKDKFSWIDIVTHKENGRWEGQIDYIAQIVSSRYLWILGDDDNVIGDLDALAIILAAGKNSVLIPLANDKINQAEGSCAIHFAEVLNKHKGIFQFISSWIIPASHFRYWLAVAKQYDLKDEHCLINLAALIELPMVKVCGLRIMPLPSIKTYEQDESSISDVWSIFWDRPQNALYILSKYYELRPMALFPYRLWSDKQIFVVIYVIARDKCNLATKSAVRAAIPRCYFLPTKVILFALTLFPLQAIAFIARLYSHSKYILLSS